VGICGPEQKVVVFLLVEIQINLLTSQAEFACVQSGLIDIQLTLFMPTAALPGELWGPASVSALCDFALLVTVCFHVHPLSQLPGHAGCCPSVPSGVTPP